MSIGPRWHHLDPLHGIVGIGVLFTALIAAFGSGGTEGFAIVAGCAVVVIQLGIVQQSRRPE